MKQINLTEVQRSTLIKDLLMQYPNQTWQDKLNKMSNNQLWAIHQRFIHKPR